MRSASNLRVSARPRRTALSAALAGCCVLAALLAAGCSAGRTGGSAGGPKARPAISKSATTSGVQLTISPATGSASVSPGAGISGTASRGTLTSVSVHAAGDPVTGTMNAAATAWHSSWTLAVATRYTVTATGRGPSGQPVTQASTFTTLTPARTFQAMIFEGQGDTYGVGMPVILTFSQPITDKAAVEQALQLRTSRPVVGAWYWDNSQTVEFRPRSYWPAGTTVSFTGHLNGVEGAPGMYGFHTLTQSFRIG